jgi:hypothetical protein
MVFPNEAPIGDCVSDRSDDESKKAGLPGAWYVPNAIVWVSTGVTGVTGAAEATLETDIAKAAAAVALRHNLSRVMGVHLTPPQRGHGFVRFWPATCKVLQSILYLIVC